MKLTNVSNYTVTWFTKHAREVMMLVEGFSCNVLSASQEEHDGWTLDGWKEWMTFIGGFADVASLHRMNSSMTDRASEGGGVGAQLEQRRRRWGSGGGREGGRGRRAWHRQEAPCYGRGGGRTSGCRRRRRRRRLHG